MSTITLTGRAGSDPERRSTASGKTVADFRFAATRRKKQSDGTWADESTWWTVVAWDHLAEDVLASVAKGDQLVIHARVDIRVVEGQDGSKRVYNVYNDLVAEEIGKSIRWAAKNSGVADAAAARVQQAFSDEPF